MRDSQQPPWRGRPRGSWCEEEAAREHLRAHKRQLKNVRPSIVIECRAPMARQAVRLPGLTGIPIGGEVRKRRFRQPRTKSSRAPGKRPFAPLLRPIDDSSAQVAPAVGNTPPAHSVHRCRPVPPAYRPSPELIAAIVSFQTEELEQGLEQLRLRRRAEVTKQCHGQNCAERAIVQAERWDTSLKVCMAMAQGLHDGFRSSTNQLRELQRRFVASRSSRT